MKKTPFTRMFWILMTLAILLTPIAAMAEEEVTSVEFSLSNQPKSYRIVKSAGLDTSNLYLNGIPYTPQLNPKGDIVMRNIDLASAQVATDMIKDYDTEHPNQPFDSEEYLKIISGKGLRVDEKALPDKAEVTSEIQNGVYPTDSIEDYAKKLKIALTSLSRLLENDNRGQTLSESINSILKNLDSQKRQFSKQLLEIYTLLYNIRSKIASEQLPQSLLSNKVIMELISVYRSVLEQGGVNLAAIEFWGNDAAWMAYAATQSGHKLTPSGNFLLSDKVEKINITVTHIWIQPVVPEPEPPDEHVYEPPMPPFIPPEVPM